MIHEATRTLVKSPPEIWEQCSDPESLSRHLNGSFGEIRITRLEPESTVAWEGEHGSGTVTIEPSAWGTRVTLRARTEGGEEGAEPEVEGAAGEAEEPEGEAEVEADEVEVEADEVEADEVEAKVEPEAEEPEAAAPAPDPPRESLLRMVMRLWRRRPVADPVPVMAVALATAGSEAAEPEPEPEPVSWEAEPGPEPESESAAGQPEAETPGDDRADGSAILMAALESMGQAHHRPYSRG